jgi:starch synthase
MKILMVAAEHAPHAKMGGLADATAGLGRALSANGHDVRILLPRYAHLPDAGTVILQSDEHVAYRCLELPGNTETEIVYLCDVPALADVQGIYAEDERDALRFVALAEAAAALAHDTDWRPDVIHCHDWHAGLVPISVRSKGSHVPTVLTLHNIGYQGVFPATALTRHGCLDVLELLPPESVAGQTFNFLRAGIATATAITTVSPTYAREIQTAEYGMGLETLIASRRDALTGILNGVDY